MATHGGMSARLVGPVIVCAAVLRWRRPTEAGGYDLESAIDSLLPAQRAGRPEPRTWVPILMQSCRNVDKAAARYRARPPHNVQRAIEDGVAQIGAGVTRNVSGHPAPAQSRDDQAGRQICRQIVGPSGRNATTHRQFAGGVRKRTCEVSSARLNDEAHRFGGDTEMQRHCRLELRHQKGKSARAGTPFRWDQFGLDGKTAEDPTGLCRNLMRQQRRGVLRHTWKGAEAG